MKLKVFACWPQRLANTHTLTKKASRFETLSITYCCHVEKLEANVGTEQERQLKKLTALTIAAFKSCVLLLMLVVVMQN